MGVVTDFDEGNISTSIKELNEEEHQDYLVVRENFKAKFLKGSRKTSKTKSREFKTS